MKKYTVIISLICGFYLMFLFAVNFISAQEGQKETIILESSMGNVTLSHQKHTTLDKCDKCHHTGLDNPKCSS